MKRLVLIAILLAGCGADEQASTPAHKTNGEIAFASNRDGDFDIYVMDASGRSVRNLTRNRSEGENEADDDQPAWSPDGAMIAFLSTRDHRGDGDEAREVYVMDADGDDVRRLTKNRAAERNVQWTPDGRLVFWRCSGGVNGCALVEMFADGGGERTLFRTGYGVGGLAVSPDGAQIAFSRWDVRSSTFDVDVVVSDLHGIDERRLTSSSGGGAGASWSPDGSRLVFVSERDRHGKCLFHDCVGYAPELYVMNADGSGQRRLTEYAGYDLFGTWSPDGEQILFARLADQNDDYELYVVDVEGGSPRRLTDNHGWDWMADWGPE